MKAKMEAVLPFRLPSVGLNMQGMTAAQMISSPLKDVPDEGHNFNP